MLLSPHRFLAFLLASPETSTNFSSTWRRQRRRAEIIIGAERADYSQTMRAAGSINGFLNDHCPGEYPVYIRGGLPPPLLLLLQPQTPPGILDSLGRLLAHPPTLLASLPKGGDEVCSREIKHGCSRFPQRSARIHGLTRVLRSTPKAETRECAGGDLHKKRHGVFLLFREKPCARATPSAKVERENMNASRDTIFRLSRNESFRLISASARFFRRCDSPAIET